MHTVQKFAFILLTAVAVSSAFCSNKPADTALVINDDIYSIDMKMDEYVIYSKIIGDYFKIDVSYPPDAEKSGKQIPVIYITDGQWRGIDHKYIHYLSFKKLIRPVYAVGVGFPQGYDYGKIRERDLTDNPEKFAKAFAEEIIPFVEAKYKIDPQHRILYGASYGGYFTLNSLFINESFRGLFETFIAACSVAKTPSAENELYSALKKAEEIKKNFYFGVGSADHPYIVKTNENIINTLSSMKTNSLNYKYFNYKDKDHYTVCRNVFIDGLLSFYGIENKKTTGISDMIYQEKTYTFNKRTELYDWTIMNSKPYDAAKNLTITTDSSSNVLALKADFNFTEKSSTGSIMTVFDHFENFKGKTLSAEFFVPENEKGNYKIALRIQTTYNWISDESDYEIIDKTGWQKLVFKIDDSCKNGNPELLRAIGFSIKRMNSGTENKSGIMITNISWK